MKLWSRWPTENDKDSELDDVNRTNILHLASSHRRKPVCQPRQVLHWPKTELYWHNMLIPASPSVFRVDRSNNKLRFLFHDHRGKGGKIIQRRQSEWLRRGGGGWNAPLSWACSSTWIRRNDGRKSVWLRACNRRDKKLRRGESLHRSVVHSPLFIFSFCLYLLTYLLTFFLTLSFFLIYLFSYLLTNLPTYFFLSFFLYLLTNLLTYSMEQRPSWETNHFSASQ